MDNGAARSGRLTAPRGGRSTAPIGGRLTLPQAASSFRDKLLDFTCRINRDKAY